MVGGNRIHRLLPRPLSHQIGGDFLPDGRNSVKRAAGAAQTSALAQRRTLCTSAAPRGLVRAHSDRQDLALKPLHQHEAAEAGAAACLG